MLGKQTTVIHGGGLAGLSLGIALRKRGLPVELHEAGNYPRHRVCGEFIAGANRSLFDQLGITRVFQDALNLETTLWHCGRKQVFNKRLPTSVTSISRYLLDERLSRLFLEMGGVMHCGSRIQEDSAGREGSVWATGRRPNLRENHKAGWIGLKCHLSGLTLKSDLEFYLGRNGYLGLSPVSENRFNLCGLFRLNRRLPGTKLDLLKHYLEANELRHLIPRVEEAEIDPDSWCAVAGLDYRKASSESNGLRIGDQFGLIAPLTGNGMSIAFESAALAAPVIERWANHQIGWRETIRAIHATQTKAFAKRKQVGRLLQVLLLHPLGQSVLRFSSVSKLVPFNTLYALTHHAWT